MKKLIIIFFILLIAGGVVFFFGWMNIFVPGNSYGVMVSKTSGYDEQVVGPESGFVWRWQNLIPTNITLFVFTLSDYTVEIKSKGSLPSGEVYTQAVPYNPDFSYDISFSITFRLRPSALLNLVKNDNLTPDSLPAFYEKRKESITSALLEQILLINERDEIAILKNPFSIEKEIIARLRDSFSDIELVRLSPLGEIKIPDPAIYHEARKNYLTLMQEHRTLEIAKMRRARDLFEGDDIRFERSLVQLEQYGELFNKYPVLLKYLFITKGQEAAKELPEIKQLFEDKGGD